MTLELEMPSEILLRPAGPEDFAFAERLYVESTGRLLRQLDTWDEAAVKNHFAKGFLGNPSQIICVRGEKAGWLQVSRQDSSLHLHQVHLAKSHRNRGIGSRLMRAIMGEAAALGLPLTLKVVRGNRATRLYRRLGFRVVDEDKERLTMYWDRHFDQQPSVPSDG